jgi:multicomponent Na+:H+ antiporter subunit E
MAERGKAVWNAPRVRAYGFRLGLLLILWWILSGSNNAWWFGFPLAAAAAGFSLWLTPPARFALRMVRFPAFTAFFLWQSLLAGWDVARRTLHPRLPLHPEILHVALNLPPGAPTWWLMLTISLLPGTLSVRLHGERILEVHCLDSRLDVAGSVRDTELQIARLYGLKSGWMPDGDRA